MDFASRQRKNRYFFKYRSGGGRWIRTTEGIASRFTVCPLWPLGNSPIFSCAVWSWWTDSNPRPADYKSAALPTELHQHLTGIARVSVKYLTPERFVIIADKASFVKRYFSVFEKNLSIPGCSREEFTVHSFPPAALPYTLPGGSFHCTRAAYLVSLTTITGGLLG